MPLYFDNNATTPVAREVAGVMNKCLRDTFGNPSSGHALGQQARKAVEKARGQAADLINAKPHEIIFTSGGTESNNMSILGTALRYRSGHIITSCIEHPSVSGPITFLETLGYQITRLPVNKYGIINPGDVLRNLKRNTILMSIMHSNNETGSIQPIAAIGKIARERGIIFHCDAAQSVGKVPVDVRMLKPDLLTIVSHKFYGPKGVGAIYIRGGVELKAVLYGASHERGLRPGTENVASIAGLGKACGLAKRELKKRVSEMRYLSGMFYDELRKQIPGVKLHGHLTKRLPNTLNLYFPAVSGSALLERLKNEIAASTGSACHEGRHSPSSVLKAMGLSDEEALSSIRLSLGRNNTKTQVIKGVKLIAGACRNP